jgi:hypothetical protein
MYRDTENGGSNGKENYFRQYGECKTCQGKGKEPIVVVCRRQKDHTVRKGNINTTRNESLKCHKYRKTETAQHRCNVGNGYKLKWI